MTLKKMGKMILVFVLIMLVFVATITIVFDPFFHYHAPFEWQTYILNASKQRYQNDGIARHFEYDAMITGTSMTENFKTSEFDELFGVNSIKTSFSGGDFKEINDFLERAVRRQPNLRMVIRGLDLNRFLADKDKLGYSEYPEYLYDDILINDVKYLFNKDVLLDDTFFVFANTIKNVPSTTFDEYAEWDTQSVFGKDVVMHSYTRPAKVFEEKMLSEEDCEVVRGTVEQNIISLAKANPQIDFYYFLTPYSIVYWDSLNQTGETQRNLDAQKLAVEMILECDNIHLFSFLDMFEIVTDLNIYKDTHHYNADVNSLMLHAMKKGEHQITKDNCEKYFESVEEFYTTYNYDALFE